MTALICWLAMAALLFAVLFAVAVEWGRRCRKLRPNDWRPHDHDVWRLDKSWRDESLIRRTTLLIQNFILVDTYDRADRICAYLSFWFGWLSLVSAAAAFAVSATESVRVTANQLICTYIAGGFFEIIGIVTTVEMLISRHDGTFGWPLGWAKIRGPALIIAGIALGFIGNVKSISVT